MVHISHALIFASHSSYIKRIRVYCNSLISKRADTTLIRS